MNLPFWRKSAAGLLVALKVQPGARQAKLGPVIAAAGSPGWPPARLKLAVVAPPEDGRANDAVLKALAAWLGISTSRLVMRAGNQARDKLVLVVGGGLEEFRNPFASLKQASREPKICT